MSGKDKQTDKKGEKETKFTFRLSEEDKDDLEYLATQLADGNKSLFLVRAIQKFRRKPELWNNLDNTIIEDVKQDIAELREELVKMQSQTFEQNQRMLNAIEQMATFLLHQQENNQIEDFQAQIENALLEHPNPKEINTYKKIEDFLVSKFPDKEKELREDRVYNDVILELLRKEQVEYNVRSRKLKWRGVD
ncbi:MAG: hypothetical protein ACTSW1_01265 [Candidatus Hodarchaeales archaeon]